MSNSIQADHSAKTSGCGCGGTKHHHERAEVKHAEHGCCGSAAHDKTPAQQGEGCCGENHATAVRNDHADKGHRS